MDQSEVDEAVRLRRAVSRLARRFNATATDEGLTPTQGSVLGTIAARGPISVAGLLEREHINPSMLSRVVGKLDDAELIRRRPNPDDQRSAVFEITAKGRRLHERVKSQRASLVLNGMAELSPAHQTALRAALDALDQLAEVIS